MFLLCYIVASLEYLAMLELQKGMQSTKIKSYFVFCNFDSKEKSFKDERAHLRLVKCFHEADDEAYRKITKKFYSRNIELHDLFLTICLYACT